MTKDVVKAQLVNGRGEPIRQRQEVYITLNTQLAVIVFQGITGGAIGMPGFSRRLGMIWDAAKADDPYADQALMKVYDALMRARKKLWAVEDRYKQILSKQANMDITPLSDEKPKVVTLNYATPYSYIGASLVGIFDDVVRLMITLRHMGLVPESETFAVIRQASSTVRRVLSKPMIWTRTGVKRKDVLEQNKIAVYAKSKMGDLDERVFTKELRPPFNPEPVLKSSASTT